MGARWKRVLLKVSGEAFSGPSGKPVDGQGVRSLAQSIAAAHALGTEIAVVNGGGNILRGSQASIDGVGRATADTMGMLATVINALALQDLLTALGVPSRVLTAIEMKAVAEPYIRLRCIRHLEKGRVTILACGTGMPYFSTDTTAALRGTEIGAQVLLKGTQVDGVYDKDPKKHADAVRFGHLSYTEALHRNLRVMDKTAFTLCEENSLPIVVFDMGVDGNLVRVLQGEPIGTIVSKTASGAAEG
ncbi:MAG: UMP kinase [Planctomycetota bacterium]|nr:UMP kinase [Planctomycetota bacterium]